MAAVAACFSASEDAAAASLAASTSEGSMGSCFGSSSGGCEAVEDDIGADCRFVVVVVPDAIEAGAVADRVCVAWRACMAVVVICIAVAGCAACWTGSDPAAIAWIS